MRTLLHSDFWRLFRAWLFYNPELPAQDVIRNLTQYPHKPVFNCGTGRRCSLIPWRVLPSSPEWEPWDQFPSPDKPQTSWNGGGAGSRVASTHSASLTRWCLLGLGWGWDWCWGWGLRPNLAGGALPERTKREAEKLSFGVYSCSYPKYWIVNPLPPFLPPPPLNF